MALKLQRRVVDLVASVLSARADLSTPDWLMRPGRRECGELWSVFSDAYLRLTGLVLPEEMPPRERREVDEVQHFNEFRALTLEAYPADVPVAFPVQAWRQRSRMKERLEGGGFGAPKPPLFPGEHGRHKQRAFRDMLCDLLPSLHGYNPTLRIGHFEVEDWIYGSKAADRIAQLLQERVTAR